MIRTTIRQALIEHPDALWRHHLGCLHDSQELANRMSSYLSAEAYMDEATGTLYTLREIARIEVPRQEETHD